MGCLLALCFACKGHALSCFACVPWRLMTGDVLDHALLKGHALLARVMLCLQAQSFACEGHASFVGAIFCLPRVMEPNGVLCWAIVYMKVMVLHELLGTLPYAAGCFAMSCCVSSKKLHKTLISALSTAFPNNPCTKTMYTLVFPLIQEVWNTPCSPNSSYSPCLMVLVFLPV